LYEKRKAARADLESIQNDTVAASYEYKRQDMGQAESQFFKDLEQFKSDVDLYNQSGKGPKVEVSIKAPKFNNLEDVKQYQTHLAAVKKDFSDSYLKDAPTGTTAGEIGSQVGAINQKWDALVKAEQAGFEQYKQLLDQRVKYGAISQSAANILLEQQADITDRKTESLRKSQASELEHLVTSNSVNAATKTSIQTKLEEIRSTQEATEATRAFTVVKRQEKDALIQASQSRKLDNDIAAFITEETIKRAKMSARDTELTSAQRAAQEAYNATLQNGERTLKGYTDALNEATTALNELQDAYAKSATHTQAETDALEAQKQRVDSAAAAHSRMSEVIKEQAESTAGLAFNTQSAASAARDMQTAYSAASAVMDAMLNARKESGFYTDMEAMRAEGNINKEKIAQLTEIKAAYEAMGASGAAAAAQIEAQIISLSSKLDPLADKIRSIFENAFTTFFEDLSSGTKSVKDAFKDLARSIAKDFSSMLAKNMSQQLMKFLGDGLEPGGSQGLFGFISKLLVPDDIGKDIAARGSSIYDSIKSALGVGASYGGSGGASSALGVISGGASKVTYPSGPSDIGSSCDLAAKLSDASSAVEQFGTQLSGSVSSIDTLTTAATAANTGLTGVGASSTMADTGLVGVGASSTIADMGLAGVGTTAVVTDSAIAGAGMTTIITDAALASTAVSATAAASGLTAVAATSGTSSSSNFLTTALSFIPGAPTPAANGHVFSSADLHQYANTIVSSPTLFRFAQGGAFRHGLMGEAGPEAIMPLARDRSGKLGVRTTEKKDDVSAQPASKGYRIINVIDPSLVSDYMASSSGEQLILNTISRNPGSIRQLIGG